MNSPLETKSKFLSVKCEIHLFTRNERINKKIFLQLTRENPLANSDLRSSFFPFHDPYALLKVEGVFNKSFL